MDYQHTTYKGTAVGLKSLAGFYMEGVKEIRAHTAYACLQSYCHPVAIQDTFTHSYGGADQIYVGELYYSALCRTRPAVSVASKWVQHCSEE